MEIDVGKDFEIVLLKDIRSQQPQVTLGMTGKLGFNKKARELFEIEEKPSAFMFAKPKGEDVIAPPIIKLVRVSPDQTNARKPARSGNYHYLNFRRQMLDLQYPVGAYRVVFGVRKEGENVFVLEMIENQE